MSDPYDRLAAAASDVRALALEWPLVHLFRLSPGANIVVAGAYEGRAMELLATVYPEYGRLVGFEPQPGAREVALKRLARFPRVTIEPYGIAERDGTFPLADNGSIYASFVDLDPAHSRAGSARASVGELREVEEACRSLDLDRIDLLLLNVEGYEWLLLPHMLLAGMFAVGYVERLALQVHWGMGYDHTLADITQRLEATHKRVFDEIPSWGYWQWSGERRR